MPKKNLIQLTSSYDDLLKSLKSTTLKHYLQQSGIPLPTPVNKVNLFSTLNQSLQELNVSPLLSHDYGKRPLNLLSVDVGVRNFSFCRFEISKLGFGSISQTKSKKKGKGQVSAGSTVVVTQWYKMNLHEFTGIKDESLNPLNYSKMVNKLIWNLIYPPSTSSCKYPDIILVERQRFRSGSQNNVLETILKTNVLEHMLISSLETASLMRPELYHPQIISCSPQAMAWFWKHRYCELTGIDPDQLKTASDNKLVRLKIVQDWLNHLILGQKELELEFGVSNTPMFQFSHGLQNRVIDHFNASEKNVTRFNRFKSPSRRVYELVSLLNTLNDDGLRIELDDEETALKKGDDMADSLLHGVSYLMFHYNKVKIKDELDRQMLEIAGNKTKKDKTTKRK
ncbi:unnamed protein product [Ambrosiozyma monospora]|uniref:Unnamed protein product n=1 Tax=Ambrosiozyma monospora TaxID=43982 RepID=A0A9W6YSZ7_AMBMO|nr:unnamed protein product [Ambrosiozyma monospora]